MTKIKIGQVRLYKQFGDPVFTYVVTGSYKNNYGEWWETINVKGHNENGRVELFEKDELLATYPTWQEAVASKEFNQ